MTNNAIKVCKKIDIWRVIDLLSSCKEQVTITYKCNDEVIHEVISNHNIKTEIKSLDSYSSAFNIITSKKSIEFDLNKNYSLDCIHTYIKNGVVCIELNYKDKYMLIETDIKEE